MGCVLDEKHVLTARHVWSEIQNKYSWPVVAREEGLFKCEVVFESKAHDILVLHAVKLIHEIRDDDNKPKRISSYPILSNKRPFLGCSIGFMSNLKMHITIEETEVHSHMAVGNISMLLPDKEKDVLNFSLSGTVIQKGFSGSAVFLPDGKIIGVIIETISFAADFHNPKSVIYLLPVMAPLYPVFNEIKTSLESK
jgi:hypothetical protein